MRGSKLQMLRFEEQLQLTSSHCFNVSMYSSAHFEAYEMANLLFLDGIRVLLVKVIWRNHGLNLFCFAQSYRLYSILPNNILTF